MRSAAGFQWTTQPVESIMITASRAASLMVFSSSLRWATRRSILPVRPPSNNK